MAVSTDVDLDRLNDDLDRRLARADAALARQFPGDRPGRQPVHTVYVPADRYRSTVCREWGDAALATLDEHNSIFAALVDEQGADAVDLESRVRGTMLDPAHIVVVSQVVSDLTVGAGSGLSAA